MVAELFAAALAGSGKSGIGVLVGEVALDVHVATRQDTMSQCS
jgi:hypothetical protein